MVQALQLGAAHGLVLWLCLKLGQSLAWHSVLVVFFLACCDVVIAGSGVVVAGGGVEWPCGRVKHPEKVKVLVFS